MPQTQLTSGTFKLESETELFFDSKVSSRFFTIEREVPGRRLFDDKPKDSFTQNLRIDRILHPTQLCYKSGWYYGPIGVELKASDIKLGGIFAQVLEQRQSLFRSSFLHNTRIIPSFFAIFPAYKIVGDMQSLLNTQFILACHYNKYDGSLCFSSGNKNILSVNKEKIIVDKNWKPSEKRGHRGTKQ